MSSLRDLYQEVILDHNRSPRNFGVLEVANRFSQGDNPLCGDKIRLYVQVEDDVVVDVKFDGSGCAISTASASLMPAADAKLRRNLLRSPSSVRSSARQAPGGAIAPAHRA